MLLPVQPFVIADLACALLSLFLLVAIACRLAPDDPWVPAMAALASQIAIMSSRATVSIWGVPWSTTPAAPLILAALLCTMRYIATTRLRDGSSPVRRACWSAPSVRRKQRYSWPALDLASPGRRIGSGRGRVLPPGPQFWRACWWRCISWCMAGCRGLIWRLGVAGLAVAVLLLPWRASLEPMEATAVEVSRAASGEVVVALPFGLALPGQGALRTGAGPWDGTPAAAGRVVATRPAWPRGTLDIGVYPVPGGVLVLPLRPLPGEPVTLSLGLAIPLRAQERARSVRLVRRPGIPWQPAEATGPTP